MELKSEVLLKMELELALKRTSTQNGARTASKNKNDSRTVTKNGPTSELLPEIEFLLAMEPNPFWNCLLKPALLTILPSPLLHPSLSISETTSAQDTHTTTTTTTNNEKVLKKFS